MEVGEEWTGATDANGINKRKGGRVNAAAAAALSGCCGQRGLSHASPDLISACAQKALTVSLAPRKGRLPAICAALQA